MALKDSRDFEGFTVRGRLVYAVVVAAAIGLGFPVLKDRLLGFAGNRKPAGLVIESLPALELSETVREGNGALVLDLDGDAQAYFDGAPGEVTAHFDHDVVWLDPGSHSVMVVKPGVPTEMGTVTVRPTEQIELKERQSGR